MTNLRLRVLQLVIPILGLLVCVRLFYWMIIQGPVLARRAESQRDELVSLPAARGDILSKDGAPLVTSAQTYLLYAYKPQLTISNRDLAEKLSPIIGSIADPTSDSAKLSQTPEELLEQTTDFLEGRLNLSRSWVVLKHYLTPDQKKLILELQQPGLGFEDEQIRYYPEGSMSAQLLGFVSNNINGQSQGYYGLEGYYNRTLQGREGKLFQETDASGKPILMGNFKLFSSQNGRTLKTTINRAYQFQIEKLLEQGVARYGAKSGSVVVMEPSTGAVLAMASWPRYDPRTFYLYPPEYLKNPVVADLFEPGSVFKPLVMAAAIDAGAVKPDTACDSCSGPVSIGTYTVSTWNNNYYPDTTMIDTLVHSDNTGMVFAARKLTAPTLHDYLDKFGIGRLTLIDLQEEVAGRLRKAEDWKEIDLATISFGQGIAVTPIQLVSAINALANQGQLVTPHVVSSIADVSGESLVKLPPPVQVVSRETADIISQMMVATVEQGEAKWTSIKGVRVAGKTGTAQIPIKGHYDETKTIASFVGFAPSADPKFTMLVTLREPTTSPWGSETAAPLWFTIARYLLLLK